MKLFFVLIPLLAVGCGTKDASTGDDTQGTSDNGGGDTSTSGDDTSGGNNGGDTSGNNGGGNNGGGDTGVCNDDNEDCTPNTCGGEGENMLPGADCLVCHTSGRAMAAPPPEDAPPWTLGGTIFSDSLGTAGVDGATITVTDSRGQTATMTSSRVGNFYWSRSLTPPLTASVTTSSGTLTMASEVNTGACNSCHQCDGSAGGKLYAP